MGQFELCSIDPEFLKNETIALSEPIHTPLWPPSSYITVLLLRKEQLKSFSPKLCSPKAPSDAFPIIIGGFPSIFVAVFGLTSLSSNPAISETQNFRNHKKSKHRILGTPDETANDSQTERSEE
jgi:hypothetical protein